MAKARRKKLIMTCLFISLKLHLAVHKAISVLIFENYFRFLSQISFFFPQVTRENLEAGNFNTKTPETFGGIP